MSNQQIVFIDSQVTDYQSLIAVETFDYGDAPDIGDGTGTGNYETTADNDGAAHAITNNLSLGSTIDADDGTQQNSGATADDEDDATTDKLDLNTDKLNYEYFNFTFGENSVDAIPESGSGIKGTLDPDLDWLTQANQGDVNDYGIRYTGYIKIETAGEYTFYTTSDDGTTLSTDNTLVVNNDGLQATTTESGKYTFDNPGYYPIKVEYFEATGKTSLTLEYESTDAEIDRKKIPGSVLAAIGDDEDSITSFDPLATNFDTYSVDVAVTNNTDTEEDATLIGWIDFDGDGAFEEDETATATVSDSDLSAQLDWSGLQSLADGINAGTTYARFRLSSDFNDLTIDDNTSVGAASDGEVEDYQLSIKKGINGTDSAEDTLIEGSSDDYIVGNKGEDTLTGGAGNDIFYFNETGDGVDSITDFIPGEDQIDLSTILADEVTAYTSGDPFAQGYVEFAEFNHPIHSISTIIQIDFDAGDESDPSTDLYPKDVAFLRGIAVADLDTSRDFII